MALYFTSDHHFGHANIIRYTDRPHPDVDTMNAALVDLWNDTVAHDDEVWVLGDFALGRINQTLPVVRRLHGHKHLLPGNHDACWPMHRNHITARRAYLDAGFESILDDPNHLWISDAFVTISHFPYVGDGPNEPYDQRYAAWRPHNAGRWLLHGHIHQLWRTRGRQINVGVDAWAGRPVALDVIEKYVANNTPTYEPPIPWDLP